MQAGINNEETNNEFQTKNKLVSVQLDAQWSGEV